MIAVNRVTKVVKGGRILGFAALTVVGDGDGRVGMGKGKAKEVPVAVQKAMEAARRNMVKVSCKNGTIQHKVVGEHGAARVLMAPAPKRDRHHRRRPDARGVRSDGHHRHRLPRASARSNPYNIVRATLDGLKHSTTPGRSRRQARQDGRRDLRLSDAGERSMAKRHRQARPSRSSWCAASSARKRDAPCHGARPGPAQAQQRVDAGGHARRARHDQQDRSTW